MALYAPSPEAKGWLWRQLGGSWYKLWAVLRGGALEFYTNSQVSERHSVVYIDFRFDIEEVVEDADARKAGQAGKRWTSGFLLKASEIGEELSDCDCAGVHAVLLAACSLSDHTAWRKKLQSCANSAHAAALAARRHETAPLLMASESCFDAGVSAPSALVVARLCAAGREQGRELLRLVRGARLAFHSGALPASFTVETAGAGRAMQALLARLQAMQAAVVTHSELDGEDTVALAAAQAWLARAGAWVAASQDRLGALVLNGCLPSQWGVFAHAAADKLQGIENAMQSERAAEEARTLRAAAAAGARCYTARGSVMPYRSYWANKVAI
ncbi:hypothetical protein WJX81_008543 [Elliptochloris bilobata]|uniref:PH domain-containing protein n=1 Tax=Elliptochloris bilobata TaxID=381761 RepID=A0AAW1SCK0_9CHLO